jgi:hypothetical protein
MLHILRFFLNAVCFIMLPFFDSCIIHILHTGCAKIKKKIRRQRVKGACSLDMSHSKWNSRRRFRRVNIITFWNNTIKGISDFAARCRKHFYIGILPWLTSTCLSVFDRDFCFTNKIIRATVQNMNVLVSSRENRIVLNNILSATKKINIK